MDENYSDFLDENIDRMLAETDKLLVIDFWNESCIVCKRMTPMLNDLAMRYRDKVIFAKINVDRNPLTTQRFEIKGLPTFLFVKRGKVLERFSGAHTRSEFIEIIERY